MADQEPVRLLGGVPRIGKTEYQLLFHGTKLAYYDIFCLAGLVPYFYPKGSDLL